MSQLHVEGWSPEYGASVDLSEERTAASPVDTSVEVAGAWNPIDGVDDGVESIAFVDGVRRVDARLTLDDPSDGPIPGLCGSFGVGATEWDRTAPRSSFRDQMIGRVAVMGHGVVPPFPDVPGLTYAVEAVHSDDPGALVAAFHQRMRDAEASLANRIAAEGTFVVADGPINDLGAQPVVGFVKSHRVTYLAAPMSATIGRLRAGQRTPLFVIDAERFGRYSWYLRLADLPGGHSWTGIVRCEARVSMGLDAAVLLADRTAALLPTVASKPHTDPRAPQNLVPIAALERHLRRRMGDQSLVYRALRSAMSADRAALATE